MLNHTDGHRQRIKEKYLHSRESLVNDYEVLELLLTYAIPRRDVKPIAKELIKTFGSLNNVLNATVDSLSKVDGIGTNAAILITLIKELGKRGNRSKNNGVVEFAGVLQMQQYFCNILANETVEKIIFVTLNNSNKIISSREFGEGSVNKLSIDPRKILEVALNDNAASAVVAHNHPGGEAFPSAQDINFTLKLRDMLDNISVKLLDHIIVGDESVCSMKISSQFSQYFK